MSLRAVSWLLLCPLTITNLSGKDVDPPVISNVPSEAAAPVVGESTPFRHVLTVRNPYDRAVRVDRLDTTCSCSKLVIKDKFLLPKGETTLEIEVANVNRSGPQSVGVSLFLTDPDFVPIETKFWWQVEADVQVDGIAGDEADTLKRPANRAWHDVYRYSAKVRPDEMHRLLKRIRLSSPAGKAPEGGLKVLAIEYPGTVWKLTPLTQSDGSILITATAREPDADAKEGEFHETAIVRTNHPRKAAITLSFDVLISKQAGATAVDPAMMGPAIK